MWCFFFWTRLFVFRICFYLWDIYGYEKFTHHLYKNAALETDLIARLEFFDMKEYYIEAKEKKIQENGNYFISIICFLIQKGAGGRAGYILAKEIRDKKNL